LPPAESFFFFFFCDPLPFLSLTIVSFLHTKELTADDPNAAKPKATQIIIPESFIVDGYDQCQQRPFKRHKHYLTHLQASGAGEVTCHDSYDLLWDDFEWLKQYNLDNKLVSLASSLFKSPFVTPAQI